MIILIVIIGENRKASSRSNRSVMGKVIAGFIGAKHIFCTIYMSKSHLNPFKNAHLWLFYRSEKNIKSFDTFLLTILACTNSCSPILKVTLVTK